ncbi:unnamed protein product [Linum trigynum]|uniref:RING-type domain-containing protein n=1 Tax=Linum trigynum TaxID=586398 RepID=A0AAV2CDB5_9ROSI
MDGNNQMAPALGGEAPVDGGDWRATLQAASRQRIVNKIMEKIMRHIPYSGHEAEGLQELKQIAVRLEENNYTAATSQSDYLRKISIKMLTMENKSQNSKPNSLLPSSAGTVNKLPNPGAGTMMCVHCKRKMPEVDSEPFLELGTSNNKAKNVQEAICPVPTQKESIFSCPICMNDLVEPTSTKCGHIFCKECLRKSLASFDNKCPTCTQKVGKRGFFRVYLPTTN